MSEIKIGLVPASRGFFSQELAMKMRKLTIEAFKKAGIKCVMPDEKLVRNGLVESMEEAEKTAQFFREEKVAGVVIGAMNFGNEIPAAEAARQGAPHAPVFLFGCREEGKLTMVGDRRDAFCGTLSIATCLRHRGIKFTFPQKANCFPTDKEFIEELKDFAAVCRVVDEVRGSSYGQIGPRPREFETCVFDEVSLLRKLNIKVLPFPLTEIIGEAEKLPKGAKINKVVEEIKGMAGVGSVPAAGLDKLARLEIVLKERIKSFNLQGLAVQCWTSMEEHYGIAPCTVMARLTEMGVPTACEVDIHGTISMHLLSRAADRPAGLADWNNRHYKLKNVFSAWHCGVFPPSMARQKPEVRYQSVIAGTVGRDNAQGTLEFEVTPGPVTLARLTESVDHRWKLLICEGEVIKAEGQTAGSHGWVEVSDLDCLYRGLLRDFPHHTGIVMGHVGRILKEVCYYLEIEPVMPLLLLKE